MADSPGGPAECTGGGGALGLLSVLAMIAEHAVLDIRPGEEAAFEAAFEEATPLIAASPGFRSLRLSRCIEEPCRYLLLVEWDALSDHIEGFRGSSAYEEWRRLLHHFYDPFPTVEHFDVVGERSGSSVDGD